MQEQGCAVVRYGAHRGEKVEVLYQMACGKVLWLCRLSDGSTHAYLPVELEACESWRT
jgi:hypothetical protein